MCVCEGKAFRISRELELLQERCKSNQSEVSKRQMEQREKMREKIGWI